MYSLVILLHLANPSPATLPDLRDQLSSMPELQGHLIKVCVNDECETTMPVDDFAFDPASAKIQPLWETAYVAGNSGGDTPPPPNGSGKKHGGGSAGAATVAGDVVNKIVTGVVGATSVGGTVEVEYKNTEKDGSSTEIKVKVNVSKGAPPMSNNNQ